MYTQGFGCHCGCHGRKHLTIEEQKIQLTHWRECLEIELENIAKALEEIENG